MLRSGWPVVALITLAAAILRLVHIGEVVDDPFYDAAVRSMSLSWHNFFFGVYEPGGSLSIDKPPVDLWLQVISTKLFGFTPTALKLPEALAGIASVPLLYSIIRSIWSTSAGIVAAVAMAVLPIEVISSRSDTMDAVMMVVILLAFGLIARAARTGRQLWLLAGAAALGIAFDIKLLESLVALPGLALFAYLGIPGSRRRRLLNLALAAIVYVAVALSWLGATLLFPAHDRPYAIGSTNGSAWNAAFIFNGTDRLGGKSPEPGGSTYEAGRHYPVATQAQRDRIPIVPPSPTRLLARIGPLSGERFGLEVLLALLLGIPALIFGPRSKDQAADRLDEHPKSTSASTEVRLRRAAGAGLGLWMLTGVVLYSGMVRLHPRYVEAFTPAVAAMLGIGVAWAATPAGAQSDTRSAITWGRVRLALLTAALVIVVYYCERLLYAMPLAWWVSLIGALGALICALTGRMPSLSVPVRRLLAPAGVMTMTLVSVCAIPVAADFTAISERVSDAGLVGQLPADQLNPLSSYLLAHQEGAHYEVAAESATAVGSLIVKDTRPILALTTYNARVFVSVEQLKRLIAQGKVHYAFLNTFCTDQAPAVNPACSAPARWIRAHAKDVSHEAGLAQAGLLWRLLGGVA